MKMVQYPLLSAKVALIEMDDEKLILDTGSPHTFVSPEGCRFVASRGGSAHSVSALFPLIQGTVDSILPGTRIHALVGNDIISELDMVLDVAGARVAIGEPGAASMADATGLRVEGFMGLPVIRARIGGVTMRLFLDTGCEHAYVLDLPAGGEPDGIISDVSPIIGAFRTRSSKFPTDIELAGGGHLELEPCRVGVAPCGQVSEMLRHAGMHGVIGFEIFRQRKILFRAGHREILLQG
jgi:hypothetical protein